MTHPYSLIFVMCGSLILIMHYPPSTHKKNSASGVFGGDLGLCMVAWECIVACMEGAWVMVEWE